MNIFELIIVFINELIKIRLDQITIYNSLNNTKASTPIQFKIKNYKKWIENINSHILNNTKISNTTDITNLKLSDKLTSHLIEVFESGNIKEIDKAKNELEELKDLNGIKNTEYTGKNDLENNRNINPDDTKTQIIDTTKIEAQPKILNGEVRPSDLRGGLIFDLRYIHGVGGVIAIKLVDNGVTLEGLLKEWNDWISKDINNSILTLYKMPKPGQYTKAQWDLFDKNKKYSILETNLKRKLTTETTMLHKIHKSSLVGIKYFHDMSLKIPRSEIIKAELILKKIASHMNKDMLVMICGSYRRGRDKSGDVDCLIAHPLIKTKFDLDNSPVNLLSSFVELLMDNNVITDQLDMGSKKFMGFCNIMQFMKKPLSLGNANNENHNHNHNVSRRIDIRFVPYESYGSAILYFTGSKTFNTNMRSHALKKGYSLNEFGLTKISDGTIIPCSTEEEIFKIINYPYKTPNERDI